MNIRRSGRPPREKPVIPTLLTLLNLCLGWLAIARMFEGKPSDAALCVMLAALLDKLDGFIARAFSSSSEFGRELDSLADLVSFGVAPALISLQWCLSSVGRPGAAFAFMFTACGALRLARFNVLPPAIDKRWFVGLPIPMAGVFPMAVILSHSLVQGWNSHLQSRGLSWAFGGLLVAIALLMVSSIRYHAFKDLRAGRRWRMVLALGGIVVLTTLIAAPEVALPLFSGAYLLHGPLLRIFRPGGASGPVRPAEGAG